MSEEILSRRRFIAVSAAAFGTLALAGCSNGTGQSSSVASSGSSANASSSGAGSSVSSAAAGSSEAAASQAAPSGKVLVACFSATGNTRAVAKAAAEHLGADYFEIEPAVPYSDEDLGYGDGARATAEQNDPANRPALATVPDFSAYDAVLLGYPIWWGKAPRLMCTLLEGSDLAGKKTAQFCTSGSSGVEEAAAELKGLAPDANWLGAKRFAVGASESEVADWVDSLNLR